MASTSHAAGAPMGHEERLLDNASTFSEAYEELSRSLVFYKLDGEDLEAISRQEEAAASVRNSDAAPDSSTSSSAASSSEISVDWPGVVERADRSKWGPESSIFARLTTSERRRVSIYMIRNRKATTLSFVRLLGWSRPRYVLVEESGVTPEVVAAAALQQRKLTVKTMKLLQLLPSPIGSDYLSEPLASDKVDERTARAYEAATQVVVQLMNQMEALAGGDLLENSAGSFLEARWEEEGAGGDAPAGRPLLAAATEAQPPPPARATKRVSMEVQSLHHPASAPATQLAARSSSSSLSDAAPPRAPDAETRTSLEESSPTRDGNLGAAEEDLNGEIDAQGEDSDDDNNDEAEEPAPYVPPVFGPPILPFDAWETVWRKLEFSDWSRRRVTEAGSSISASFVYTKANCKSYGPGVVLNRDYFTSLDEVQKFARDHYSWKGQVAAGVEEARDAPVASPAPTTPSDAKTKPQDPAEPLLSDADDASVLSYAASELSADRYNFAYLWPRLKKKGWRHKKARSPLRNWDYLPPPGLLEGDPVFTNENEVVDAIKKLDIEKRGTIGTSKRGARSKKPSFLRMIEREASPRVNQARTGRNSKVKVATPAKPAASKASQRTDAVAVQSKKRDASQTRGEQGKKRKVDQGNWWISNPVPSDDDVWPILESLGFRAEAGARKKPHYCLPASLYEEFRREDKVRFKSLQELRVFLACYGLPPTTKKAKATKSEQVILNRWVAFANVPVTHTNSVQQLSSNLVLKNPDSAELTKLLSAHRFESVDGTFYLPEASAFARAGNKLERRVHIFSQREDLESHLRPLLRGSWASVCISKITSSRRGGRARAGASDPAEVEEPVYYSVRVADLTSDEYYKTLSLRLWAATATDPLPVFTKWPPQEVLDAFFDYDVSSRILEAPDMLDASDEAKDGEEVSMAEPSDDATDGDEDEASELSEDAAVSDGALMSSPGDSSTSSTLSGARSLWDSVWPVLESKLGFEYGPGNRGFTHEKFHGKVVLSSPEDLAKYLCKHGIPEYDEKKKGIPSSLQKLLVRWVSRAYVPSDFEDLEEPSDKKCLQILSKLGWDQCDDKYYVPGDKNRAAGRIEGLDVFNGIANLRLYLRSAEHLGDAEGRTRGNVTAEEAAEVRVWAAAVKHPLPTFGEASASEGRGRRSNRSLGRNLAPVSSRIKKRQSRGRHTAQPSKQGTEACSPSSEGPAKSAILDIDEASPYHGGGQHPNLGDSHRNADANMAGEEDGSPPALLASQLSATQPHWDDEAVEMEAIDAHQVPGSLTQQGDAPNDADVENDDDEMDEDDFKVDGEAKSEDMVFDLDEGSHREAHHYLLTQHMQEEESEDDRWYFSPAQESG